MIGVAGARMSDELDAEALRVTLKEFERQASLKIKDFSEAIKQAHQQGWSQEAVACAEALAEEVLAINARGDEAISLAERQLREQGIEVPVNFEEDPVQPSRWWREDLNTEMIAPTGRIEDELDRGLRHLVDRLPAEWWREQNCISARGGVAHLREPVMLYGGMRIFREEPALHRYARGLMLANSVLHGKRDIDVYTASILVPMIAALAGRFEALSNINGGLRKLGELPFAPSEEVESRLYELATAARCAVMGRNVEILFPQGNVSPDFRIHDLPVPAVVECKMQSRLSASESRELACLSEAWDTFLQDYRGRALFGDLQILFTVAPEQVGVAQIVHAARSLYSRVVPYGEVIVDWGHVAFNSLEPAVELNPAALLYGPRFLRDVFGFRGHTGEFDGICGVIANDHYLSIGRASLPFCMKWRTDERAAVERKARHLTQLMLEAIDQIPIGEAGLIYIAYEDTHRAEITDLRTKRIMDTVETFFFKRRGVMPLQFIVNRLHPQALEDGKPDLIESAVIIGKDGKKVNHMPALIFVPD